MDENKALPEINHKILVKSAPESSGVYVMKDSEGVIIYVGKAKSLRNRLSSYFTGRKDAKTRHLVSRISSIEWIMTSGEYEALLLENELIKRHSPKYNINLKDGKTYPVIRVSNEEFPRVFRTRRVIDDGSRYYGPFPSAETIDAYLDLIRRLFPLRRCRRMGKRGNPCMYYHIGRCSGPCAGKIDKEDYLVLVANVEKLLSGKTEELLKKLYAEMDESSGKLLFEKAAGLRDAINAIETFKGRSGVIDWDPEARDYIAWDFEGSLASFNVFSMRTGKLNGRDLFRERSFGTEEEAVLAFLAAYYTLDRPPPARIFVCAPHDYSLVARYFSTELKSDTAILIPGEKRHDVIMAMARQNAHEDIVKRRRESGDAEALEALRAALSLEHVPTRIEGFDIAHLSGKHTVASLVSFLNAIPDKKNYRYFKIRSLEGAIDDFESLREAISRRYTRLLNEDAELPDLIMVDGGLGQVNAARGILDSLEMEIPVVGLAKANEELWLPDASSPIVLEKNSLALRVMVAVRDETHRFATGLNQRLRGKELSLPALEGIAGIGSTRAKRIMQAFGSLEAVAEAEPDYIAKAAKIPAALAIAAKDGAAKALTEKRRRKKPEATA